MNSMAPKTTEPEFNYCLIGASWCHDLARWAAYLETVLSLASFKILVSSVYLVFSRHHTSAVPLGDF